MRALVLAAHGSAHPDYPAVFGWIADRVVGNRPDLDVRVGYLDHCEPRLAALPTDGAVVVPMLLGSSYHLTVDVPSAAPNAILAEPIGPDARLMAVVADRLVAAGWTTGTPVTLAAVGAESLTEAAAQLADRLDTIVTPALAGSDPLHGDAVASYLLAPGHFADLIARCGAPVVSAPIGADPRVADVVMSRYDSALGAA
ncbi:MAG TPA: CbiX/SirB N-terminal domain-containing protein [Mycobacteriales bacterium]|nr:CbiX/SirB N-terminal domain-containing protein [Mycobacteriales bacterium]